MVPFCFSLIAVVLILLLTTHIAAWYIVVSVGLSVCLPEMFEKVYWYIFKFVYQGHGSKRLINTDGLPVVESNLLVMFCVTVTGGSIKHQTCCIIIIIKK